MIQAYPHDLSMLPGQQLSLHVSCDGPSFRVAVYRQGASLEPIKDFVFDSQKQGFQARQFWDRPWEWDSYTLDIPDDWLSGVYVCMLFERAADGTETLPDLGVATTYGHWGKAIFVVRSPQPGVTTNLVYKVPFATYHAYNWTGGGSLYTTGPTVTMHRPGGGTGGQVTPFRTEPGDLYGGTDACDADHYDPISSRQTFEHWDAKFIRWLEGNGYRCDYLADTDLDPASGLDLLHAYGTLVAVGHDEYWSTGIRANIEAFVADGGNLALFSGNTCWWRIYYDQAGTSFSCDRSGDINDPNCDNWYIAHRFDPNVQPENTLIGVSYRNGAGRWTGARQPVGYLVQHHDQWPFENTNLAEHDTFGGPGYLVGYECDGAEITGFDCASMSGTARPTGNDGTPAGFQVLGIGCLDRNLWEDPEGMATPTMGWYTATGTVFNAATTDWARVLASGEPHVVSITRTVLDRLGGNPKGLGELASVQNLLAVDGFYSADDGNRHAIALTGSGDIHEIFFHPQRGISDTVVTNVAGAIDIGCFYSDDDHYRHVIVATSDGGIREAYFHPDIGIHVDQVGSVAGVARVSGFYCPDDAFFSRRVLAVTKDGTVHEIRFSAAAGIMRSVVLAGRGVIDVGGFFTGDDKYRHGIVFTASADINELFYHP